MLSFRTLRFSSSLAACAVVTLLAGAAPAAAVDLGGAIESFAAVPAFPGFPEGVAVHGNRIYVSGPARFGTAGTGPSAVQVFDRKTGAHVATIEVAGEALAFEHALSNLAFDGDGRIYVISTQLGLIRFTQSGAASWDQDAYGAPLPDLPNCSTVPPGTDCSPTVVDFPPLPNDVVFDDDGYAYISDSLQATIFRYAPGGGSPEIWFQSPNFEGGGFIPFGTNGLRLDPGRSWVYVAVSSSFASPFVGTVYRLPLVAAPAAADLEVFHQYTFGETPDQLAFATTGELFVSLALANQISLLATDGSEVGRISSMPGDAVPLDAPAGIAFDARTQSLLIANHALLTGNPAHFAVLRTYVGDPGDELAEPLLP